MRVTSAMLADAAAVFNGKLYIHGGGWDVINTAAVPSTHPRLAVAAVVEFDWTEAPGEFNLHVALFDEDEQPMQVGAMGTLTVGHMPGTVHGTPILNPIAIEFPAITFPRAGRYFFKVMINDQELERVRFGVRAIPMGPQIPPPIGPANFGFPGAPNPPE